MTDIGKIELYDKRLMINYFDTIDEFRKDNRFCDIALRVMGNDIHAHKFVLAASSPFFDKMFDGTFLESKQSVVELHHDTTYDVMSSIVDYMYSGRMSFFLDDTVRMIMNFDYLGMHRASRVCEKSVIESINIANCIQLFDLTDQFQRREIQETAIICILQNLKELCELDHFKELRSDQLEFILQRAYNVDADIAYEAAITWLKYDKANRGELIEQVLSNITVEKLSSRKIYENIFDDDFLTNNAGGCRWLVESFLGRRLPLGAKRHSMHIFSRQVTHKNFEFNVRTKTLVELDIRPELRWCSMTRYKNTIYAVGGQRGSLPNEVGLKFNTEQSEWSEFSSRVKKSDCGVCNWDDKMFVIAGCNEVNAEQKTCSCYDFETDRWMTLPDLGKERVLPGVSFYNSALYVFGGGTTIVDRYDPREGLWSNAGRVTVQDVCSAHTIANSIYCLQCNTKVLVQYEPRTNRSFNLNTIGSENLQWIGSLNDQLFLVYNQGIELYNPQLDNWNKMITYSFTSNPILIT